MAEPNEDYIIVRMDIQIQVTLPEGVKYEGEDISRESKDRAIEAAIAGLPQNINVFIDGEDKDPALVHIDATEDDVTEAWPEEA